MSQLLFYIISREQEFFYEEELFRGDLTSLNDSMKEVIKILQDINMGKDSGGIGTGFSALDDLLQGMKMGTPTVLAARPSLGKTAFALNIVNNCAALPQIILFCSDLNHAELTF